MKFTALFTAILAVAPASIFALPAAEPGVAVPEPMATIEKRATLAEKKTATNTRMWSNSLNTFITNRKKKNPSYLEWSSDGCTSSPDKPYGWNFVKACYRHDFGYRNYKKQKRFTVANKGKIDNKFLTDLKGICDAETKNSSQRTQCKRLANTYYTVMKKVTDRDMKRDSEELEAATAEMEAVMEEISRDLDFETGAELHA